MFAWSRKKILITSAIIIIACCVLLAIILPLVLSEDAEEEEVKFDPVWQWECREGKCQKLRITSAIKGSVLSLAACTLLCSPYSGLWPQPTGPTSIDNSLVLLNIKNIEISANPGAPIAKLVSGASRRFKDLIHQLPVINRKSAGSSLHVTLDISNQSLTKLTLYTDESYELEIRPTSPERIDAVISAETFFGARHGLETLAQLVVYDDLRDEVLMIYTAHVFDEPAYPYRGLMLDTSRNYISVEAIKRTIDGMAASKLNTFHWHITDSHSFPYVSNSQPQLSLLGAYAPQKVYNRKDIADVLEFARERGVRVMPEFDAPAHVGEGWQESGFVVCFNGQPWQHYCVEPPCGQFDPTVSGLYDALEDLFKDMIEQFEPDIFHMGGDEVHFPCWNSVESIVEWMNETHDWEPTDENFVKLWNIFQSNALERLSKYYSVDSPIVLWTSTLTEDENVEAYLSKDKYIFQVWTAGESEKIIELLAKDYRIILSNYDALYLDCGFAGWVTDGNNWCSPYKGWQKVYENSPVKIAGDRVRQVLGGEAALWTEQVDDSSLDSRLWPRAAALAERLWAEPETTYREAEQRMLLHRERLVQRGIAADALEPQWCYQNEGNCPEIT